MLMAKQCHHLSYMTKEEVPGTTYGLSDHGWIDMDSDMDMDSDLPEETLPASSNTATSENSDLLNTETILIEIQSGKMLPCHPCSTVNIRNFVYFSN